MKSFALFAAAASALGVAGSSFGAVVPFTAGSFTINHSTVEDHDSGDVPVINSPSQLTIVNQGTSDANSVYYNTPVSLASPFNVTFTLQSVNPTYGPPTYPAYGADGITLTFAATSGGESQIGGRGAGLGWGNNDSGGNRTNNFIANSVALELTTDQLDGGGDSFNTGLETAGPTGGSAGNYVNTTGTNFADPTVVSITWNGSSFSETLTDTTTNSVFTVAPMSANLTGIVGSTGYLAFTAGSGGYTSTVTISSLSVSPVPEPASLTLLGVGAVSLIARRRRQA